MALIVGLTGGIGSGKTAASDYLASLGITIVDADVVAREVVAPGQPALAQIEAHFGREVILADGHLNRATLREIVFANPEQRKILEQITHPAIGAAIIAQLQAATSPYAVLASPLLLETSQHQMVKRVLLIDVPEEVQIARTTARDDVPEEQVKAIMAAQMARDKKLARAHDIISNTGSLAALHQNLHQQHLDYLRIAQTS